MLLGVLFVIWLRAAWSVRAAGDAWDWRFFLFSNFSRFVLSVGGVLILGTAAYLDAAGVQSTLEKFGTGIQLGAGFGSGAVIAAFLLIVPASGKNILVALLTSSLLLSMTGCPKAASSIRNVKEQSAKLKIYARNIQRANNDGFRSGDLTRDQLSTLTNVVAKFRGAVRVLDQAIDSAETAIREGADVNNALDAVELVLKDSVVKAFDQLVETVTGFPVVSDEVKNWIAGIRLALTTLRTLFAGVHSTGGLINA